MPIGEGRFLVGHEIIRKGDLYMTSTTSKTSTLVPISEPMFGGHIPFADGKIVPINIDGFDKWYISLPIHKRCSLRVGRERFITLHQTMYSQIIH